MSSASAPTKLRILVVDDDLNCRKGLSMLLADEGYAVDDCPDGSQALAQLENSAYDILLTDLVMPGISGLELVGAARRRFPKLRCFIMTGHAPVSAAEVEGWIGKPIDVDGLFGTLAGEFA